MNLGQVSLASLPVASQQLAVDRFVCLLADTDEARQCHFALRYRVFCEETGFENPEAFPDGAERDRYDPYARHFIVWDRYKQQWAGAMRLVDASSTVLPSEELASAPLDGLEERRARAVEFSRLCILAEYRQTSRSTFYGLFHPEGRHQADPYPVLYRQEDNDVLLRLLGASFGWRPQIEYCYFIVTAALSRVLTRFGIPLTKVGSPLEHRGVRIPFRYDVREAEEGMLETLPGYASIAETSRHYVRYSDYVAGNLEDEIAMPLFERGYHAARRHAATA